MRGTFNEIRVTVRDGLRLYARHYAAVGSRLNPVLCLPGLTRNSRDFHALATALSDPATGAPRAVYTLDLRGRGLSDYDPDPKNYAVPVEAQDVLEVMEALGIAGAGVVGTSRGGLIAMVVASMKPEALGPVVLNDIGPVLERAGLERIAGYVGKATTPRNWAEAAAAVRAIDQQQFPAVPEIAWEAIARQRFNEIDGHPAPGYDGAIGRSITLPEGPLPTLWPQFEALKPIPVMVVRGALTDLLSDQTVAEMARRHPGLAVTTVPDEGHAPLLQDGPTIAAIARFLSLADKP
jgi:pimeloyl-ACP methyl ester carboxylesterase